MLTLTVSYSVHAQTEYLRLWISLLTNRQTEELSLYPLNWKSNPRSFSSLHSRPTDTPGSLFLRAVWKSHFQVPHQSMGDANGCILLFSGPSAFGWCFQGRLGLQAAWSIKNKHAAAPGDTEVHLQTKWSTCFFSCLCAFSLVATLIASSLIIASPEKDWTVLVFSFVPDQLTYLELFYFLPLSP